MGQRSQDLVACIVADSLQHEYLRCCTWAVSDRVHSSRFDVTDEKLPPEVLVQLLQHESAYVDARDTCLSWMQCQTQMQLRVLDKKLLQVHDHAAWLSLHTVTVHYEVLSESNQQLFTQVSFCKFGATLPVLKLVCKSVYVCRAMLMSCGWQENRERWLIILQARTMHARWLAQISRTGQQSGHGFQQTMPNTRRSLTH